jgi:hypothetical protein
MLQQIKSWFNHKRTASGLAGNPWNTLLKSLRLPEGPPPKQISDYQFYLQHPDFKDKIADEYAANHADTPNEQRLKTKCAIARKFLEEEPQEVKTRIREEAAAEHAMLMEKHKNGMEGLPSVNEEDQAL